MLLPTPGDAWFVSGCRVDVSRVAPSTIASHVGNSTPRSTNLSTLWLATAKQPSARELSPSTMVAPRSGFLLLSPLNQPNSPNGHPPVSSPRWRAPNLQGGMGGLTVEKHPCRRHQDPPQRSGTNSGAPSCRAKWRTNVQLRGPRSANRYLLGRRRKTATTNKLERALVSPPHNCVWVVHLCSQPIDSRGTHPTSVPDLGLPTVYVDVGVPPKLLMDDLAHSFHPLWVTHQIDVIQECEDPFRSEQPV